MFHRTSIAFLSECCTHCTSAPAHVNSPCESWFRSLEWNELHLVGSRNDQPLSYNQPVSVVLGRSIISEQKAWRMHPFNNRIFKEENFQKWTLICFFLHGHFDDLPDGLSTGQPRIHHLLRSLLQKEMRNDQSTVKIRMHPKIRSNYASYGNSTYLVLMERLFFLNFFLMYRCIAGMNVFRDTSNAAMHIPSSDRFQ